MELSAHQDACLSVQGQARNAQCITTSQPLQLTSCGLKQGQMGGFKKVCRIEEDVLCPFLGLPPGVLEMRVKEGSKIRNLMGFAMARMQDETGTGGQTGLRQVVFSGSGRAVTKTITCAEIMKRKIGGLHQMTKLQYKGLREVWESQEGGDSEMTVHRTLPCISILLSKDPLDPLEPGYQPPDNTFWTERTRGEASQTVEKRPLDSTDSLMEPPAKKASL
ncbi:ribonuclease P protein subunit p25-like protein [Myxocyprinus asiaticus]|uniref:ribonuclease P protein subunit p25-like protein n=1 Tax=Myxocyprinus asiaticus TaxID=70543 RepID=UPI002222285B|nr:ribonuclease P protein subunit p25-like protein [Myxocyprinus asiaticus]